MNVINSLLLAGESTASSSLLSSPLGMTIILVGFIAFFYFFVIRPQNKRKKDAERMLSSIKKGDKVVSIGGIHGKVVSIKETEIVVKIDSNAEITFDKSAISKVDNKAGNTNVDTKSKNKNFTDKKEEASN